jgi:capsular polysaccharide export protein
VAIFSSGMARLPHLGALVGAAEVVRSPDDGAAGGLDAVLGWGEKPSAQRARAYATRHRLPYVRAEDGFLRSLGLGVNGDPPLSVVLDDLGIYYDARSPSRLEQMLATTGEGDPLGAPALLARAGRALDGIRRARLSKYNDAPPATGAILGPRRPRVLVVDQTAGDLSVSCGMADAAAFGTMLAAALAEHPDAEIVVKTHPDVLAGKKRGYLEAAAGSRVRLFARAVPPLALLDEVDQVYTVTSQLGFEGLIAGKPVTCFGAPFYAGWGLTTDRAAPAALARRGTPRTVEQVFAAAYLRYARYVDPASGAPCDIERVIEHLALQRAMFERNQGTLFCFGFRFWKRNYVRAYLRCPGNRIEFCRSARVVARAGVPADARVVVWGTREGAAVRALAAQHGRPLLRMEDGFLRSVGLGSDLATPASLVVDAAGIYFDPAVPSDLERILADGAFDVAELARAEALRRDLVASGLSKYNVGNDVRLSTPAGRRVVLVPGQVEDDASIQRGCPEVRTNLGLLERVRAARPDAHILWKPHPDVLSGNRRGAVDPAAVAALGATQVTDASLAQCLKVADEIHTLTSLVGFEALLRGIPVVTYGQPFYSGWGLTEDRHPVARRTRRLTLDQLVAGTLLRYPRYLDRRSGQFTTAEAIVAQLRAERDASAGARAIAISWPRRQLRKLWHVYRELTHAP